VLRYDRQIKPGLVALYDIRPGNGAGLLLQPGALHGAAYDEDFVCIFSFERLLYRCDVSRLALRSV